MTADGTGQDPGRIVARLDRLNVGTRSHNIWVLLLFGATFFELADIPTFSLTAPTLKEQWKLSVSDIGLLTSLTFLGMFVGALIGGRLADRFGRKWTLVGSVFLCGLFSMLSAVSTGVVMLGVCRVLIGMWIAATAVIVLAFASEMYPPPIRGRYFAAIFTVSGLGSPIVSWFARVVIPMGDNGWRWVYVFGITGLVIAVIMALVLPESLRWQAANGGTRQADAVMSRLEAEAERKVGALPEPAQDVAPIEAKGGLRDLFRQRYRKRTIVVVVSLAFILSSYYAFSGWVPTLLVERGFSKTDSLTYASIFSLGAVVGPLVAMPIIDRWERKRLLGVIYCSIAVLMLVYGVITSGGVVVIVGFVMYTLFITGWVIVNTYSAEIYPTRLRGIGTGLPSGIGRLMAFGGSNLVAFVFTGAGYFAVFLVIAVGVAIAGLLLAGLGERTTNRSPDEADAGASGDSESVTVRSQGA